MKDLALKIWIDQLAAGIEEELKHESGDERACRLLDAKEYLRRAYHAIDGSSCEDNETTIEGHKLYNATH